MKDIANSNTARVFAGHPGALRKVVNEIYDSFKDEPLLSEATVDDINRHVDEKFVESSLIVGLLYGETKFASQLQSLAQRLADSSPDLDATTVYDRLFQFLALAMKESQGAEDAGTLADSRFLAMARDEYPGFDKAMQGLSSEGKVSSFNVQKTATGYSIIEGISKEHEAWQENTAIMDAIIKRDRAYIEKLAKARHITFERAAQAYVQAINDQMNVRYQQRIMLRTRDEARRIRTKLDEGGALSDAAIIAGDLVERTLWRLPAAISKMGGTIGRMHTSLSQQVYSRWFDSRIVKEDDKRQNSINDWLTQNMADIKRYAGETVKGVDLSTVRSRLDGVVAQMAVIEKARRGVVLELQEASAEDKPALIEKRNAYAQVMLELNSLKTSLETRLFDTEYNASKSSDTFSRMSQMAKEQADRIGGRTGIAAADWVTDIAGGAFETVPTMLVGMGVGAAGAALAPVAAVGGAAWVATAGSTAAMAWWAAMSYEDVYSQMVTEGVDEDTAGAMAGLFALPIAYIEKLQIGEFGKTFMRPTTGTLYQKIKSLTTTEAFKAYAAGTVNEYVEEFLQDILSMYSVNLAKNIQNEIDAGGNAKETWLGAMAADGNRLASLWKLATGKDFDTDAQKAEASGDWEAIKKFVTKDQIDLFCTMALLQFGFQGSGMVRGVMFNGRNKAEVRRLIDLQARMLRNKQQRNAAEDAVIAMSEKGEYSYDSYMKLLLTVDVSPAEVEFIKRVTNDDGDLMTMKEKKLTEYRSLLDGARAQLYLELKRKNNWSGVEAKEYIDEAIRTLGEKGKSAEAAALVKAGQDVRNNMLKPFGILPSRMNAYMDMMAEYEMTAVQDGLEAITATEARQALAPAAEVWRQDKNGKVVFYNSTNAEQLAEQLNIGKDNFGSDKPMVVVGPYWLVNEERFDTRAEFIGRARHEGFEHGWFEDVFSRESAENAKSFDRVVDFINKDADSILAGDSRGYWWSERTEAQYRAIYKNDADIEEKIRRERVAMYVQKRMIPVQLERNNRVFKNYIARLRDYLNNFFSWTKEKPLDANGALRVLEQSYGVYETRLTDAVPSAIPTRKELVAETPADILANDGIEQDNNLAKSINAIVRQGGEWIGVAPNGVIYRVKSSGGSSYILDSLKPHKTQWDSQAVTSGEKLLHLMPNATGMATSEISLRLMSQLGNELNMIRGDRELHVISNQADIPSRLKDKMGDEMVYFDSETNATFVCLENAFDAASFPPGTKIADRAKGIMGEVEAKSVTARATVADYRQDSTAEQLRQLADELAADLARLKDERSRLEAEGKIEEANKLAFQIRMAETGIKSTRFAAEEKPIVEAYERLLPEHGATEGIAEQAEQRGNKLVYRMVRNTDEAMQVLQAVESGDYPSGFRIASVVDGHALTTKSAKYNTAVQRGRIPVFTSPYPTVSKLYDEGAGLLVAIEYRPEGDIYVSSRAGSTQGGAFSATFSDAEHIIDAKSIVDVRLVSAEQEELILAFNRFFESQSRRGAFRGAYRDKDASLVSANIEESRNLRPVKTTLGRPFTESPVLLPNGLQVIKGQRVRLKNDAVAVLKEYRKGTAPAVYEYVGVTGYKGELPELSPQAIAWAEERAKEIPQDRLDVYYGGSRQAAIDHGIQAQRKMYLANVPVSDIVAVWDKNARQWIEPSRRATVSPALESRFLELTKTWEAPADKGKVVEAWAAWKAAHPAEYAELEKMRAEVLKAQGYGTQTTDKTARDWTERKRQLEQAVSVAENNVTNGEAAILKTSEDTAIGRVMRKATARHKEQLASLRKELEMGQPPTRLYHGSSQSWTVYRRKDGGRSIWASDSAKVSGTYGDNLVPLYFKTDNPLIVDAQGASFRELAFEGKRLDADDLAEIAESRGYDGLIIRNFYDSNTDDGGSIIADHYTVFRPSQIKSAEVTPDATGRIIPPSEWGDAGKADIRYTVATPEQDARYLELAKDEKANEAELQKMVDEAARKAGYTVEAWHSGTVQNEFAIPRAGNERAIFFSGSQDAASGYGKPQTRMRRYFIKIRNPSSRTPRLDKDGAKIGSFEEAIVAAQSGGHDGIITPPIYDLPNDAWHLLEHAEETSPLGHEVRSLKAPVIVAFSPSQIKSADPVTRDDAGNVIPLSQRFDVSRPDIRYTVAAPKVEDTQPLRYDPSVNRHNGRKLVRGDILRDADGNLYRLDRDSGFMLSVDALDKDGKPMPGFSFSVDQTDKARYREMFHTGRNFYSESIFGMDKAGELGSFRATVAADPIVVSDYDALLQKQGRWLKMDERVTVETMAENADKAWVAEIIGDLNKVVRRVEQVLDGVSYDARDLKKRLLLLSLPESGKISPWPVPVYVSADNDANTIGLLMAQDGKMEMFEGNDEATPATLDLANRLLGVGDTKVRVWTSQPSDVVLRIRAGDIPAGIFVSPSKEHAAGYWGEGRELISLRIPLSQLAQQSEVDWQVRGEVDTAATRSSIANDFSQNADVFVYRQLTELNGGDAPRTAVELEKAIEAYIGGKDGYESKFPVDDLQGKRASVVRENVARLVRSMGENTLSVDDVAKMAGQMWRTNVAVGKADGEDVPVSNPIAAGNKYMPNFVSKDAAIDFAARLGVGLEPADAYRQSVFAVRGEAEAEVAPVREVAPQAAPESASEKAIDRLNTVEDARWRGEYGYERSRTLDAEYDPIAREARIDADALDLSVSREMARKRDKATVVSTYILDGLAKADRYDAITDIVESVAPDGRAIVGVQSYALVPPVTPSTEEQTGWTPYADGWITDAMQFRRGYDMGELVAELTPYFASVEPLVDGGGFHGVVCKGPKYGSVEPQRARDMQAGKEEARATVAPEDARYLELAQDPEKNAAELQKMVEEAAKRAGYKYTAYHGSPERPFWVFDPLMRGQRTGSNSALLGFFATSSRDVAGEYRLTEREKRIYNEPTELAHGLQSAERGVMIAEDAESFAEYDQDEKGWVGKVKDHDNWGVEYVYEADNYVYDTQAEAQDVADQERQSLIDKAQKRLEEALARYAREAEELKASRTLHNLYVKMRRPLVYDYKGGTWADQSYSELIQQAKDERRDGVILKNTRDAIDSDIVSDVVVFFKSHQAKLSDPVTRDDVGNIIPLSKRFDPKQEDIRYTLAAIPAAVQGMEGRTPFDIYKETGYWKSPGGMWVYEIDDTKLKLLKTAKATKAIEGDVLLSDVVKHPDLFNAVPAMKTVRFRVEDRPNSAYNPKTNTVILSSRRPDAKVLNSILHEIQHAEQFLNGRIRVTAPTTVDEVATPMLERYIESEIERSQDESLPQDERSRALRQRNALCLVLARAYQGKFRNLVWYEIEAKVTQSREKMTAEQRAKTPPWVTMNEVMQDTGIVPPGYTIGEIAFDPERVGRLRFAYQSVRASMADSVVERYASKENKRYPDLPRDSGFFNYELNDLGVPDFVVPFEGFGETRWGKFGSLTNGIAMRERKIAKLADNIARLEVSSRELARKMNLDASDQNYMSERNSYRDNLAKNAKRIRDLKRQRDILDTEIQTLARRMNAMIPTMVAKSREQATELDLFAGVPKDHIVRADIDTVPANIREQVAGAGLYSMKATVAIAPDEYTVGQVLMWAAVDGRKNIPADKMRVASDWDKAMIGATNATLPHLVLVQYDADGKEVSRDIVMYAPSADMKNLRLSKSDVAVRGELVYVNHEAGLTEGEKAMLDAVGNLQAVKDANVTKVAHGEAAVARATVAEDAPRKMLFRETNLESAAELFPTSNSFDAIPFGFDETFAATVPFLALGQKENVGVMLEIDATDIRHEPRKTVGQSPEMMAEGHEVVLLHKGNQELRKHVRSITITPKAKGDKVAAARFKLFAKSSMDKLGWTKTELPDGSVRYAAPEAVRRPDTARATVAEEAAPKVRKAPRNDMKMAVDALGPEMHRQAMEEFAAQAGLQKRGRRWQSIDKPDAKKYDMSIAVRGGRAMFKDFYADTGGDVYAFVQTLGLASDFKGALNLLAQRFGIKQSDLTPESRKRRMTEAAAREAKRREIRQAIDGDIEHHLDDVLSRLTNSSIKNDSMAAQHAYLQEKGVGAHGDLRVLKAGQKFPMKTASRELEGKGVKYEVPRWVGVNETALLLPLRDVASEDVVSYQAILSSGTKLFPAAVPRRGGVFFVSRLANPAVIHLAEGYATGATIHEALVQAGEQSMVVCAMGANDIPATAEALRGRYPNAKIVVVADNDKSMAGEAKAKEALEKVDNLAVAMPEFAAYESFEFTRDSDFNDLMRLHAAKAEGLKAVHAQLQGNSLTAAVNDAAVDPAIRKPDRATESETGKQVAILQDQLAKNQKIWDDLTEKRRALLEQETITQSEEMAVEGQLDNIEQTMASIDKEMAATENRLAELTGEPIVSERETMRAEDPTLYPGLEEAAEQLAYAETPAGRIAPIDTAAEVRATLAAQESIDAIKADNTDIRTKIVGVDRLVEAEMTKVLGDGWKALDTDTKQVIWRWQLAMQDGDVDKVAELEAAMSLEAKQYANSMLTAYARMYQEFSALSGEVLGITIGKIDKYAHREPKSSIKMMKSLATNVRLIVEEFSATQHRSVNTKGMNEAALRNFENFVETDPVANFRLWLNQAMTLRYAVEAVRRAKAQESSDSVDKATQEKTTIDPETKAPVAIPAEQILQNIEQKLVDFKNSAQEAVAAIQLLLPGRKHGDTDISILARSYKRVQNSLYDADTLALILENKEQSSGIFEQIKELVNTARTLGLRTELTADTELLTRIHEMKTQDSARKDSKAGGSIWAMVTAAPYLFSPDTFMQLADNVSHGMKQFGANFRLFYDGVEAIVKTKAHVNADGCHAEAVFKRLKVPLSDGQLLGDVCETLGRGEILQMTAEEMLEKYKSNTEAVEKFRARVELKHMEVLKRLVPDVDAKLAWYEMSERITTPPRQEVVVAQDAHPLKGVDNVIRAQVKDVFAGQGRGAATELVAKLEADGVIDATQAKTLREYVLHYNRESTDFVLMVEMVNQRYYKEKYMSDFVRAVKVFVDYYSDKSNPNKSTAIADYWNRYIYQSILGADDKAIRIAKGIVNSPTWMQRFDVGLNAFQTMRVSRWIMGNPAWTLMTQGKSFGLVGMYGIGNALSQTRQLGHLWGAYGTPEVSEMAEKNAAIGIKHGVWPAGSGDFVGQDAGVFPVELTLNERTSPLVMRKIDRYVNRYMNRPGNKLEFMLDSMGSAAARHRYEKNGFTGKDLDRAAYLGVVRTQCVYSREVRPMILNNPFFRLLRPMMSYNFTVFNNVIAELGVDQPKVEIAKKACAAVGFMLIMESLLTSLLPSLIGLVTGTPSPEEQPPAVQGVLAVILQLGLMMDEDPDFEKRLDAYLAKSRFSKSAWQALIRVGSSPFPVVNRAMESTLRTALDVKYPWDEEYFYKGLEDRMGGWGKGLKFLRTVDIMPEVREITTSVAAAYDGNYAPLSRTITEIVGGLTGLAGTMHVGHVAETAAYWVQNGEVYPSGTGPKGDKNMSFTIDNSLDWVLSYAFGVKRSRAAAQWYAEMARSQGAQELGDKERLDMLEEFFQEMIETDVPEYQ
jgi:phage/plasmid primase-like uncharacterized protein